MPEIDLKYAIGLPPEKAIEYFESKGYKITWNWYDLWQEAHAKAFTVAKVMQMDILQDIREMLEKALKEGITLEQFRKELEPRLKAKGWWGYKYVRYPDGRVEKILEGSPWRLKTIFRTNMQTAYMAGRYKEMMENVEDRPYWQYVAVLDSKTRPAHRALHGKVFRYDDPFWDTHYPPLGFNCRCRVRALSGEDIKRRNIQVETAKGRMTWEYTLISKKTGELKPVAVYIDPTGQKIPTDPGWSYNPGKTFYQPDLKKYPEKLRKSFSFVKAYGKEPDDLKDIKNILNNMGIEYPKLFPRQVSSITEKPDPKSFMFVSVPFGQIFISNISRHHLNNFNPKRDLISAFKKIWSNTPLSYNEEVAIAALWHELIHLRVKDYVGIEYEPLLILKEVLVELTARHTYDKFLRLLGAKAMYKKDIIKTSYGYDKYIKQFREYLKKINIKESEIISDIEKIITTSYRDFDTQLAKLLETKTGKRWEAILNDILFLFSPS